MEVKTANTLQEAYNNLDPNEPLPAETHPFYVPRPEEFSYGTLLQALSNAKPTDKFLFSGYRGSGKSTELLRISAHRDLRDRFIPIYVNVEQYLDLGDVGYQDVLILIGLRLMEEAARKSIALDEKYTKPLVDWYQEVVFEKEAVSGREITAEVSLQLIGHLGASFRRGSETRRKIRDRVEHRLSELLEHLGQLMEAIQQKSGKPPLTLVDGLDKVYDVKKAVEMFLEGAGALTALKCPLMYTVPLSLLYDQQLGGVRMAFRSQYQLPNIRTYNRDGSRCESGRGFLHEVLKRRVSESIFPPEAREEVVELSGGVLKHLLSLSGEAVLRAMQQGREKVLPEDVEYAARQNRLSLSPTFTASEREVLKRIAETHSFENAEEERRLAINLHILRYIEDDEEWWDIHPLLEPLLRRWFSR